MPGVTVGQVTKIDAGIRTGVTAILPHQNNLFQNKVTAACKVLNGFGKSCGLIQVEELGAIETPILLTNTLNVGTVFTAVAEYMLEQNPDIGLIDGTVNPVVGECNDAFLNDIRGLHITKNDALTAILKADKNFEQGNVGAGAGMSCYELAGGIGSASRSLEFNQQVFTLGVLVLSNFGKLPDLVVNNQPLGATINQLEAKIIKQEPELANEKGSIMMIIATDLPLSSRQLKRVCLRAAVGMARTGSYIGHGSGDIVIAFSNSNLIKHRQENDLYTIKALQEECLDQVFRATVESIEEAILNSMFFAEAVQGFEGRSRRSLRDYMFQLKE